MKVALGQLMLVVVISPEAGLVHLQIIQGQGLEIRQKSVSSVSSAILHLP